MHARGSRTGSGRSLATIALSAFSYAAKAAAVAVKLHDNQSALIEAAKEQEAEEQVKTAASRGITSTEQRAI